MEIKELGELCVSYKYKSKFEELPIINSSEQAHEILRQIYNPETIGLQEQFTILFLNRNNRLIGYYNSFIGGGSSTVVDNRIIIGIAVKLMASSVIIAHNHPSGNTKASDSDKQLTLNLKQTLKCMEIVLLDHIILSPCGKYLSFTDEGLL